MLSSLVIVHTYLALNNLTTWEFLSWTTISYINVWPRKYGSPFSQGTFKNVKFYFCYPLKKHEVMQWEMPTELPTVEEGENLIKNAPLARCCAKICD